MFESWVTEQERNKYRKDVSLQNVFSDTVLKGKNRNRPKTRFISTIHCDVSNGEKPRTIRVYLLMSIKSKICIELSAFTVKRYVDNL